MATFTANNPELYETRDKIIFFKEFMSMESLFGQLFDMKTTTKPFIDRLPIAALGRFQHKPEGTPTAFSDPVSGIRTRVVVSSYSLGYRNTHEAISDDQWEILSKMPGDLADSARDHRERLAWALVNDQFAGAIQTGLDGVALMSAAHVNLRAESTTVSNILSPAVALSVSGLESIMTLAKTTDDRQGRFINLNQAILVVHPALSHTAYVLLEAAFRPGSADNDPNTVGTTRSGIRVLSTPYKASQTTWSVHDKPGRNGFSWYDREQISFNQSYDAVTRDLLHFGYYRATPMTGEWRGNYGSAA